jgi:hypothetical protein
MFIALPACAKILKLVGVFRKFHDHRSSPASEIHTTHLTEEAD